ncbi:unnamed protein product, partial [Medioppia subpectinata]
RDPLVGDGRSWAVITGATDGIGLSYARQLAHKRYNLLLISRSADKLEKVRNDLQVIQQPLNTTTKVLDIDFTINTDEVYDRIGREVRVLDDIHVLINNVGMGYPDGLPVYFVEQPDVEAFSRDMINANIVSCTRLTAQILPAMVRRGRGVVVNVSSFASNLPIPLIGVYSATKAYMDYFSRALEAECRHTGVIVQSLIPNVVLTKMNANIREQPSMKRLYPTADEYVKQAIRTVGRQSRAPGCRSHCIMQCCFGFLRFICDIIGVELDLMIIQ